ncbi:MAG: D-tyrosyl-tRNA(Tyr) deacylase [Oligoflexia bacterium]|nr:D-tyrosyl-tRNA(Tyr) deacylase [Oligoflexia bacterium]
MRALLQRVSVGRVSVEGRLLGEIGPGIVALIGFGQQDSENSLAPMLENLLNLRIFPDERGRFHFSLLDTKGGLLLIPQFTLYAETSSGRRPDFFGALAPEKAKHLFEQFVKMAEAAAAGSFGCGEFGAHMLVEILNDGPVTIMLDDRES